ncbi:DJ-1/PfpI family protein [Candidatus Dependentiae bacterium]|nr:DJ-1/PfpI family protein [Candidatus Dependentiae bacterium]MBU4387133.1 DJ-1/PfpI family protein [Candidatus Dependentiae bacterium]
MQKNILFILMPKDFRDEEFYEPYNLLKEKNYNIDVAGMSQSKAIGVNGYEFMPNLSLKDLTQEKLTTYDALVIPGGPGSVTYLWSNKSIQDIILEFNKNKKIIAAICYGVIAIVEAGILINKKATVYPSLEAKDILQKHNVTFEDSGCVILKNEKIITCQGPKYANDFGHEIINLLEKK